MVNIGHSNDGVDNDDIGPNDSVSNVGKHFNKHVTSKRSSITSSAQIKAAAERAALVRMAALKERHALEEQEQLIKRKKEQLGSTGWTVSLSCTKRWNDL